MPQREIVYTVVDNTRKGLNQLDRNLKRAERSATGLGGTAGKVGVALGGLAGIAAGAGAAIVGNAISSAREINNLANISQFGSERLQAIGIVAERSGASLEDVADTSRELQLRLAEAATLGSGPAVDALDLLGLSIEHIQQLRPEDQWATIRDRLSEVEDPALRAFAAEELLGGASERLAETLALSADEFDRQTQAARESGAVLSADAVQAADRAGEALGKAGDAVKGLATGLVGSLAPALETGASLLEGLTGWLTDTTFGFGNSQGAVENYEDALQDLINTIREEEQYEISVAEARERATMEIEAARQAAEGYIGVARELIAVNEAAGWGPYTIEVDETEQALERMISAQGTVVDEHPALVDALYAEADAYRAQTQEIERQIGALAANREARASVALLDIGRQDQTRADYQLQTLDFSSPSELYDPGQADPFRVVAELRDAGYEWDAQQRRWQIPEEEATRSAIGGVSREIVDQATQNRRLQLDQLDQLYADGRISELQYEALVGTQDLASTLNDLVADASTSELSALDGIRRSAYRTGDLTAKGSRDIVEAVRQARARESSRDAPSRDAPSRDAPSRDANRSVRDILRDAGLANAPRRVQNAYLRGDGGSTRQQQLLSDYFGSRIPSFGSGGIVRRPTLALVGESGPEAITPLSQGPMGHLTINLVLDGTRIRQWMLREMDVALQRGEVTLYGS